MMHHYLSMANNVVTHDLSGREVKLKKYFYALRPVLASGWIADRGEVPPMEFAKLKVLLTPDISEIVDDLLSKKATADERYMIKPIPELHRWLANQIEYCEQRIPPPIPYSSPDSNGLNILFRNFIA
jgi:uncharacterized protein